MKRKFILTCGTALAVTALVLLLGSTDSVSAQAKGTFEPTLTVTSSDTTPEVSPDLTLDFSIEKGDLQFGGVLAFVPKDAGIVVGNDMPVGTGLIHLESDATLGLINAPCNTVLPVAFDMVNGSLDKSDTVEFTDADINGQRDVFEDKDDNGLYDGIDKYPAFINRIFPDITPIRRTVGITSVAGVGVLLQFLLFPPGTVIEPAKRPEVVVTEPLFPQSGDPELGYPSLVTLQDIGDPEIDPEPSPITDFCTPLASTTMSFGKAQDNPDTPADDAFAGTPTGVNPLDGTYPYTIVALSQRDTDGDGFENLLDTCPFVPNDGNPREINSGDVDGDGLDSACDPNDDPLTGGTNSDEDLDGYPNRGDNCPLDINGQEQDNQKDVDLDQLGDACDTEPNTPNGERFTKVLTQEATIGTGTGAGGPPDCSKLGTNPFTGEALRCYQPGSVEPTDKPDTTDVPGTTKDDDGGSNTGLIIGIIAGVAAAVVVVGGGAAVLMRRRNG